MKALIRTLLFFAVILIIGACVWGFYAAKQYLDYYHNRPPVLPASLTASPTASSTDFTGPAAAQKNALAAYLARKTVASVMDISTWNMYENAAMKYGMQYPAGVTVVELASSTVFTFPTVTYFHWPLQDTVTVTVSVAPSCPSLAVGGGNADASAQAPAAASPFTISGYGFERRIGNDAAAGNIYNEIAYDTRANDSCYHISLLDHGTNGAGFYVSDKDLIARYDAQHEQDMSAVLDIFTAMLVSFSIRK